MNILEVPLRAAEEKRKICVFVSSTFQDMVHERDVLARWVFPEMRAKAKLRGVVWRDVDLRWGLTEEELHESSILETCLREIDECRPFFIGLLGERYGWNNFQIPDHVVAREPWIASMEGRSITELEMTHGALGEHADPSQTVIFLRSPLYVKSLPQEERFRFEERPRQDEVACLGEAEALRRAANRRKLLYRLKELIREAVGTVVEYQEPDDLKRLARTKLMNILEGLFPESSSPSENERETMRHESFLWSLAEVSLEDGRRVEAYVPAPAYGERLDAFSNGTGGRLAILGEPGSGKSALIANWLLRYRQENPEAQVIFHVVGATPQASSVRGTLARVTSELGREFGGSYQGHLAQDLAPIFEIFLRVAASQLAAGRKLVLVVDGLDKLDDGEDTPDLSWLPESIPNNVCFIVSTSPGRTWAALRRRGWPSLEIQPLSPQERREVISRYLSSYRCKIEEERARELVESKAAASPLLLRTILDEIRVLGRGDDLDPQITKYLFARSVSELFHQVLTRCSRDYEERRPHLIRDVVCYLWATRYGLIEDELLELLGQPDDPLPAALWSPVRYALGAVLVSDQSGMMRFTHGQFREVVEVTYIASAGGAHHWHRVLADYFQKHEDRARALVELPWHLERSEQWERLAELLSDSDALAAIGMRGEYDLRRMWAGIERNTDTRLSDIVRRHVSKRSSVRIETLVVLRALAWAAGETAAALDIQNELVLRLGAPGFPNVPGIVLSASSYVEGADSQAKAMLLRETADSHIRRGHMKKARELLNEARAMCDRLDYAEGRAHCLRGEAHYWSANLNFERALQSAEEACAISEALSDDGGVRADLTNRCGFLTQLGRINEAKELHVREEALARELEDWAGLARSLNNQASLHVRYGDAKEALQMFEEAYKLAEKYGDAQSRAIALSGQAHAHHNLKNGDQAFKHSQAARHIAEEATNLQLISHCLALQASLLPSFRKEQVRLVCDEISRSHELKDGFVQAVKGQLIMRGSRRFATRDNRGELQLLEYALQLLMR